MVVSIVLSAFLTGEIMDTNGFSAMLLPPGKSIQFRKDYISLILFFKHFFRPASPVSPFIKGGETKPPHPYSPVLFLIPPLTLFSTPLWGVKGVRGFWNFPL